MTTWWGGGKKTDRRVEEGSAVIPKEAGLSEVCLDKEL